MSNREALGEFEQIVLLAVARLGDAAYGVSIREEIKTCTGRSVSRGSIYVTLDRLEARGYIRTWLADPTPERGGKSKRLCALEPGGVRALIEARKALDQMWRGLDPALGSL
jgi:PadR family transcriptional regulator, regulatory protein PadR